MDSGLHRRVPQAADPKQTGPKALLPQLSCECIRQGQITGLKLSPIEHHSHRGTWFIAPIPGHRVGARHHRDALG